MQEIRQMHGFVKCALRLALGEAANPAMPYIHAFDELKYGRVLITPL